MVVLDEATVRRMYEVEQLSLRQMQQQLQVTNHQLRKHMDLWGIQRRSRGRPLTSIAVSPERQEGMREKVRTLGVGAAARLYDVEPAVINGIIGARPLARGVRRIVPNDQLLVEAREAGLSAAEMAELFQCSKRTVWRHLQRTRITIV